MLHKGRKYQCKNGDNVEDEEVHGDDEQGWHIGLPIYDECCGKIDLFGKIQNR